VDHLGCHRQASRGKGNGEVQKAQENVDGDGGPGDACGGFQIPIQCPSMNSIFRPGPVFSLFAILDVALPRLRLQNRCGLGRGRDLQFLDVHIFSFFNAPNMQVNPTSFNHSRLFFS
jgi:hypothetical protein